MASPSAPHAGLATSLTILCTSRGVQLDELGILDWRPRLRPSIVAERAGRELQFVSTLDRRVKRFTVSPLTMDLVALLDGERSVADLIAALCGDRAEAITELCTALLTLRRENLINGPGPVDEPGGHAQGEDRPTARERTFYDRQIRLFQDLCDAGAISDAGGPAVQRKLTRSRALICGVGGLGSVVATALASAGVGHLTLCDHDSVDETNLHRQILYSTEDIGRPKVDCAARRLAAMNPYIDITPLRREIAGPADLSDLAASHDLVIGCADQPTITVMAGIITQACWPTATAHILGGAYAYHVGILGLTVIPGVTACWHCLLAEVGGEHDRPTMTVLNPTRRQTGITGAQSGIIGNIIAWEAIRLLTGMPTTLTDQWIELDYWPLTTHARQIPRHPLCPQCGQAASSDR